MPGKYEVVLKSVEEKKIASVREVLPAYSSVGKLFDELVAYGKRHEVQAIEWMSVWHDQEYKEENVDGEAAFVTSDPLSEDERVCKRTLPAVPNAASTVHQGPFDTIGGAYAALLGWIEENGYPGGRSQPRDIPARRRPAEGSRLHHRSPISRSESRWRERAIVETSAILAQPEAGALL